MTWVRRFRDGETPRHEVVWSSYAAQADNYAPEGQGSHIEDHPGLAVHHQPLGPHQALMEALPHQEPEQSAIESQALRERLADALEGLEPRQRWIFEAYAFRGLSVRVIAKELALGKSYVHRQLHVIRQRLADELADDPLVRPHLRVEHSPGAEHG